MANAITPWLLVAFLLGSAMPDTRWAVAAGAGALLLALVGYYGMVQLRYGYGGGTGSWIFWGLGALVGGPVFGVAGHWWRGPVHRRRAIAIGLLGAVAVAEGAYNVLVVDHRDRRGRVHRRRAAGAARLRPVARRPARRVRRHAARASLLGAIGYLAFTWLASVTSAV